LRCGARGRTWTPGARAIGSTPSDRRLIGGHRLRRPADAAGYPPTNLPRLNEITIDLPVLGFAFGVSVLSGLLFGLVPILRLVGRRLSNLAGLVHGGGRWASAGKNQYRAQNALVVVQVALALVMLVSSGLMIRTFQNLRSVEPGFTDPATVQTVRLALPGPADALVRTQQQLLDRLAAIRHHVGSLRRHVDGADQCHCRRGGRTYESGSSAHRTIMRSHPVATDARHAVWRDFDWTEPTSSNVPG
jgi:hypothetical protein